VRLRTLALAALVGVAQAQGAGAGTVWNESGPEGDLSNNRLAPTLLSLSSGPNSVTGAVTAGERDYFRITVPENASLAQIVLAAYGTNNLGFFAIQRGTQITVDPAGASAAPLLGWVHTTRGLAGTNILDNLGNGAGAMGFTPPLGPGDYSFWMQQANAVLTTYTFDLVIVPEPSVASLLAAGLVGLALARRRRTQAR
jgi:hypothetical protein